jgi:hypothetical protein
MVNKYLILFIALICLIIPVMANGNTSCYAVVGNQYPNCGLETNSFEDWTVPMVLPDNIGVDNGDAAHTGVYGAFMNPSEIYNGDGFIDNITSISTGHVDLGTLGNIDTMSFWYNINTSVHTGNANTVVRIGSPIGGEGTIWFVDVIDPAPGVWVEYSVSGTDLEAMAAGNGSTLATSFYINFIAETYKPEPGAGTASLEVFIDDVDITFSSIGTCTNATNITSNSATLCSIGGTAPKWFKYGQLSGHLSWETPNFTGNSYNVHGSPLLGNTVFYYSACDESGCGSEQVFKTLSITPQAQTTFSHSLQNITDDPSNIAGIASESVSGYFWLLNPAVPTSYSIVWGLVFFAIFLGLWIRERDLTVPVILGLITGTFIMYSNAGLNLGIPVYFQSMAQGIAYASLAGVILAFVKRS